MTKATFETPDGEDIEVDSEEVVELRTGDDEDTTVIVLDDGDEITVVAIKLAVVAELGLDPLDYVEPDDDEEDAEEVDDDGDPREY